MTVSHFLKFSHIFAYNPTIVRDFTYNIILSTLVHKRSVGNSVAFLSNLCISRKTLGSAVLRCCLGNRHPILWSLSWRSSCASYPASYYCTLGDAGKWWLNYVGPHHPQWRHGMSPDFNLIQPWLLQVFEEWSNRSKHSLSHSLSLIKKLMFFNFFIHRFFHFCLPSGYLIQDIKGSYL